MSLKLYFFSFFQEYNFHYKPGNVSEPPPIVGKFCSLFSLQMREKVKPWERGWENRVAGEKRGKTNNRCQTRETRKACQLRESRQNPE